jgi:carbamoyltransferase
LHGPNGEECNCLVAGETSVNILGLNYVFHDSTACLVQDGRLTVAIEEERLTRRKHTGSFPLMAVSRCLETAGLTPGDIDHVAVSYRPSLDRAKKAAYGLKLIPTSFGGFPAFVNTEVKRIIQRQMAFRRWFEATFAAGPKPTIHQVPHHVAHAVGSFFVSPYESAALLSTDGSGEWATTFKGVGRANTFRCLGQDYFPRSQGDVYGAVTEFCGYQARL